MPYVSHKKSRSSFRKRSCKSPFSRAVSRVIGQKVPVKQVLYSQNGSQGLVSNQVQILNQNLFHRVGSFNAVTGFNGFYLTMGGSTNAIPGRFVGGTFSGNVIYPKALLLRGVFRNYVYSPDTTVRLMLVKWAIGTPAPTASLLFMGLTQCKLVDQFCWTNYTLVASKDFHLRTAKHTGNHYLPQSKPGGTSANNATGTYWDTPGVSVVGNTDDTYVAENLVYFNANTMSGSYAEHTVPFTWSIPLSKKIPKLVYNEGIPDQANMQAGDASVDPSIYLKDWTFGLVTYTFTNSLVGTAPALPSCSLDELTYQTYFKSKD